MSLLTSHGCLVLVVVTVEIIIIINPLTATDVYIRQILLFSQRIHNMFFIFIVVLRTWQSLTPKDVTAVKGLK
jgi:uncharacterized membrane protein